MRAVRWYGRGDVRITELPDPEPPPPGSVTIAVEWVGLCGTDRQEWRSGPHWVQVGKPHPLTGRMAPITLGHEVSGRVAEVGPGVETPRVGELVAVDGLIPCHRCWWCLRHVTPLCESLASIGMHADGGLADFMTVPAEGCVVVAPGVSSESAALAEPIAVAIRALRRGRFLAGESVVVFGAGMIGLACIAAARAFGARSVTAIARSPDRRELAGTLGADVVLDSTETGTDDRVRTHHAGRGPDIVIDTTGDASAAAEAITMPRKGGRTVIVGFPPSPTEVDLFSLAVAEREVIGTLSHVWDEDFRGAVAMLDRGVLTADQVVSARIPLEETVSFGFERDDWKALPGVKVLVSPRLAAGMSPSVTDESGRM